MENSFTNLCQNETITKPSKTSENKTENVKGDSTKDILSQNGNVKETNIITIGRIYLITNLINNKKYVGITTKSLKKRFQQHCWDAKRRTRLVIHHAIKKYGEENFKIELVEELQNTTEEKLFLRESFYIDKYDTLINNFKGYNMAKYGGGKLVYSEETRKKMSMLKDETSHNPDLTLRRFRNVITNEEFRGNRYEFRRNYNFKKRSVDRLVQRRSKKTKGWILLDA